MKNPIQQFRRFFFRGKKYNTSTARTSTARTSTAPAHDDDEDDGHQLSGAFVIVLVLHLIAIVGVFAFARIKEKNKSLIPPESPGQNVAAKAKPTKPSVEKPAAPVAAAVTPAVATPVPAHDSIKAPQLGHRATHIVQIGDTLSKIAFAFKVDVDDLVATNKLKNRDDIRNGQALAIPDSKPVTRIPPAPEVKPAAASASQKPPAPANDKKTPKTYIVKKNDTAVKIARENGCTYEELVKLNNIKDPKKIQLGQVLKLPAKGL